MKRELGGLPVWGWLIVTPVGAVATWALAEVVLVGGPF